VNAQDIPSSNAVLIDEATREGKLQKAAVKRNKIAMANFTNGLHKRRKRKLNLQSGDSSGTRAWSNGLASLVTDALEKAKYMPQDNVTRGGLRQMLHKVSTKPNSNRPGSHFRPDMYYPE
jgi:hypothetical protein